MLVMRPVVLVVLVVLVGGQTLSATGLLQSTVAERYRQSETTFLSDRHFEAEGQISALLSDFTQTMATLSADDRGYLARAYSLRAQLRYESNRPAEARQDLAALLAIAPAFEPDSSTISPEVRRQLVALRAEFVGTIVVRTIPGDATVDINGTLLSGAEAQLYAGSYTVTARRPGYPDSRRSVEVAGGQRQLIEMQLVPSGARRTGRLSISVQPADAIVIVDNQEQGPGEREMTLRVGRHRVTARLSGYLFPQLSAEVRADEVTVVSISGQPRATTAGPDNGSGISMPSRFLLLRGNGVAQLTMRPFSLVPTAGRSTQLRSEGAFEPTPDLHGYELGGMLRLWRNLGLGATASHVELDTTADVSANLGGRFLSARVERVPRIENTVHAEIGVLAGGDKWSVAVFFGPSWLQMNQVVPSTAQSADGNRTITNVAVSEAKSRSKMAANAGLDLNWMFMEYVGVGITGRYTWADMRFGGIEASETKVIGGGLTVGSGLRIRF